MEEVRMKNNRTTINQTIDSDKGEQK